MLIRDHAIGQPVAPALSRNVFTRPDAIERDERRGREDLGERSGLERFRERARPHAPVGPPGRRRENLARGGIEHHDVTAIRFHVVDRVIQRALRDLLQLGIEREHDVVPGHRFGNYARGRFVFATFAILQHHGGSRRARQQAVE